MSSKRATFAICALIFFVALGLRVMGIGWGLKNEFRNQSLHPDEPLIFDFVHRSHVFRGPLEREYYNYGTLFYGVLRITDAMGVAYGGVPRPESLSLGDIRTPKQWDDLNAYVSQFHLWGRYASAVAGALTAALIFLIMRRWSTITGALAGAALIAFSPAHVEHSRFQTVDVLSLFFVTLATLSTLRLLRPELTETKTWLRDIGLASVLAGLAASTRYSDGLMLLPVLTAVIIRRPKRWPLLLAFACVVMLIGFVISTPGVVTDTSYWWSNFQYQASHANSGHGLVFVGRPVGFVFHIYQLMIGMNVIGVLLGIAGLLYAAVKKHHWAWIVLAFFVPYYLSIGAMHVMFLRYGFPLYVGVACGFAYAISSIERRANRTWLGGAVALLALASFENPQGGIRGSFLFTQWMMGRDPRDEAGQYLREQSKLTPGLDVGILGSSPWFWSASVIRDAQFVKYQPRRVQAEYLAATHDPKVVPFVSGQIPLFATYGNYEVEEALRLKGRADLAPEDLQVVQAGNARIEALDRIYQAVSVFGGDGPRIHDLEYIRPTIWVLKRRSLP